MKASEDVFDMKYKIQSLLSEFGILDSVTDFETLTNGRINRTIKVSVSSGHRYILQSVNTDVFKNVEGMMNNIALISDHLQKKTEKGLYPYIVLNYHPTNDGYLVEREERKWRLCDFLEDSVCSDDFNPSDRKMRNRLLAEAGHGFGKFTAMLTDFDSSKLIETIPNFHNTPLRLEHFCNTVDLDIVGRCRNADYLIEKTLKWTDYASELVRDMKAGLIPLRVTHNDTKTNNILFDKNLKPMAVIDLDTVMPGLVCYDFADAIRYSANTASEDEKDLSNVSFDIDSFRLFAEGFILETKDFLTESELSSLCKGVATITFEQAVRFLDDYLAGDVYYKIDYPEHNLDRAKNQFRLFDCMIASMTAMEEIVASIGKK